MSGITRMITGKASPEQAQALEMQKQSTAAATANLEKQETSLKASETKAALANQGMIKSRTRGGRRALLSSQRADAELGVKQDTLGA